MFCHECAPSGNNHPAVALCRFCLLGLCKMHLVQLHDACPSGPQYACHHRPGDHAAYPVAAADNVARASA